MDGDPIYLRPPDTHYRIQGDPSIPLRVGVSADRQWLVVPGCRLEFDTAGQLVTAENTSGVGAEEAAALELNGGTISVLRFWLPDRQLGISDHPLGCCDLPDDPAEFGEGVWRWLRTTDWADGRMFTLQLGKGRGELWIDRYGTAHLLSK